MKRVLLLLPIALSALVQNSVIDTMDDLQRGHRLQLDCYPSEQLQEVQSVLGRSGETIRIMSFNVMFNTNDAKFPIEHRWPERKFRVIEYIKHAQPDIICVQEPMKDQVRDLLRAIGIEYAFFGVGQSDGRDVGEVNGIFYLKDRFTVLDEQILFMSLESDRVSTGPLSRADRTLTMLVLRDDATGKPLAVFNTHFPFREADARINHAHFIAEYVEGLTQRMPVFVCGDLNTFANRPDITNLPYYDGDYVERILTSGSLRETRDRAILGHVGPISTFTNATQDDPRGFQGEGTPGIVLDHIYLGGKATPVIHAHDSAMIDGNYPSDHMPVVLDVLID